jgi:hypothetical protein
MVRVCAYTEQMLSSMGKGEACGVSGRRGTMYVTKLVVLGASTVAAGQEQEPIRYDRHHAPAPHHDRDHAVPQYRGEMLSSRLDGCKELI